MQRDFVPGDAFRAQFARVLPPEGFTSDDLRLVALHGREAMSQPFSFRVSVASPHARLDAHALLGKPMGVALEAPGATGRAGLGETTRYFHGHVAAVEHAAPQGRFHGYVITLAPWTGLVDRNRDCRIFQERSVPDIVAAVFGDWPQIARFESRLTARYAHRRYAVQYRESDMAFVSRLLEEEGIGYHFEHDASGHLLVLTDPGSERRTAPGYGEIAFDAGQAARLGEFEAIVDWRPRRRLRASRIALADYDFKRPAARPGGEHEAPPAHAHGEAERFDPQGGFFNDETEGPAGEADAPLGTVRAQVAFERMVAAHEGIAGEARARGLACGARFTLTHAPAHADRREVLVTALVHRLEVPPPEARTPGVATGYRASFAALPLDVAYRPPRTTPRPRIEGLQSAVVLGPRGAEIHTDRFGRVKLGFHWDRNARGDRKPGFDGSPLPDEERTCWVRVSEPWAGQRWGATLLPRVGQEVLVDFIGGDPDRPVVTGRVVNAAQMPVAFSGVGTLPADHALAGLRSKEIGGAGYNELVFDDTPGELRVKLSSEHAMSQLNLGHLAHPREGGKATPRGEGFELRSEAWGALRAAKGLLLTADARMQAGGAQLDRHELVRALEEALVLARSLGMQAKAQNAGDPDAQPQAALAAAAKAWGAGANAERDAKFDAPGGQPIVAVSAPAGIALTTPRSITGAASSHVDLVAQKNVQLAGGERIQLSAGTGIGLFAHSGGIHAIAHRGPQVLQAQADDLLADARRDVRVSAAEGHVLVQARQHVTLVESGGAYIKLAGGGVEIGGPGALLVKMAAHRFSGPARGTVELPTFMQGDLGRGYRAIDAAAGAPIARARVQARDGDDVVLDGLTGDDGRTPVRSGDRYAAPQVTVGLDALER